MAIKEIEKGKHYKGKTGPVRFVKDIEPKQSAFGTWYKVYYQQVLPGPGYRLSAVKTCDLTTIQGWAKSEFDPNADPYISPLRVQAENVLIDLLNAKQEDRWSDKQTEQVTAFVTLVVTAAKDELRKEFL